MAPPDPTIEARHHDDAGTVRDRLLGLSLLRCRVALGVDDVVIDAGLGEGLVEEAPVVGLPPR